MKCALCLNDKKLLDSHIFPEFLYKPLYDENHKFLRVSTNPKTRTKKSPKGITERLLCSECEGKIGKYEDYASKVLNVRIDEPKIFSDRFEFQGIDYQRFKLFQISLLWRAHITTREEYSAINLGIKHSEIMRRMIFEGKPGKLYEYGCIVSCVPEIFDDMKLIIIPPIRRRISGHRSYLSVFGGLIWIHLVSGHANRFAYRDSFLSKKGQLNIYKQGSKAAEYFKGILIDLKNAGKL